MLFRSSVTDSLGGSGSGDLDLGSVTDSLGGSGSGDLDLGSIAEGSLAPILGSVAGSSGSSGGSGDLDLGSVTDSLGGSGSGDLDLGSLTDLGSVTDSLGGSGSGDLDLGSVTGSLESIIDSITAGSSNLGSSGNTIVGSVAEIVGSSSDSLGSGSNAGAILAIGSLAAVGVGVHSVANAGVQLPPLPAINVGAVCNLPQEAIDFLKDNGSMERHECEPEEEQP